MKACWSLFTILACCTTPGFCQVEALKFEAENWTEPKSAWQVDTTSANQWNLWSKDSNADKKWSGGVVLQSPRVMEDRKRGGEGAPVLHTVITDIPAGQYDVELQGVGRVLGVSFDGTTWQRHEGGLLIRDWRTEDGRFEIWVDDCFALPEKERRGSCYYDCIIFYPTGEELLRQVLGDRPQIDGHAKSRREEVLDRGVVALRTKEGVYVGWRLLKTDPADASFDVFREVPGSKPLKLNTEPVWQTSDFVDTAAPQADGLSYSVRLSKRGASTSSAAGYAVVPPAVDGTPYLSIPLADAKETFQKIAFSDLDGDGIPDFVVKQPNSNIDPATPYWHKSETPYTLEGYRHDGKLLWKIDLGWAIETGIWYSPFIVHDLDGDGKAEVIAKTGEGDPRDEEGRVETGEEWLTVFNGETGEKMAHAPWPNREGYPAYARMCRNQMAVGYLDGKTPCVLALRGTYDRMKVDAYEFHDGALHSLWRYDSEGLPRRYQGQGEHFTRCVDVDGDGRDEVELGSMVLDDNGYPLWTIGMGHPDHAYIGDIDPLRPGLEIYYGIETRAQENGMCLVDAATGKILWGFDEPTRHIHGKGICADLDPRTPGMECFGLDCLSKRPDIRKGPWMWAANGELLWYEEGPLPRTYGLNTAYWDADLQKEVLKNGICDYRGGRHGAVQGSVRLVADLFGDWREEIVTSVPGEIRVYSTTIPATDRRVSLLQDPIYRGDMVMNTMGYHVVPTTSFNLEAHWPGMNLTVLKGEGGKITAEVVVSAPLDSRVTGHAVFRGEGLHVSPASIEVDVPAGQRAIRTISVTPDSDQSHPGELSAELIGEISEVRPTAAAVPRPADFLTARPAGKRKLELKAMAPFETSSGTR